MGLGRMSAGGRGRSPEVLPGSEQWPRDVSTDHGHMKTSALLQNQPMVITKTCFPLQIFLALIRLWLINAIRNYLIMVFKEIKPRAPFKTLFLGVFTQKNLLVQLSSAAGGKREIMSVHAGVTRACCRFNYLQSCCEILHELQG